MNKQKIDWGVLDSLYDQLIKPPEFLDALPRGYFYIGCDGRNKKVRAVASWLAREYRRMGEVNRK